MNGPSRFEPPKPVGEPFRGDPASPAPFPVEGAYASPPAPYELPSRFPPGEPWPPPVNRQPPSGSPPPGARAAKAGLLAGVASLLITPLLGPVAIVLGTIAMRRGQRKTGAWALGTGIAGTVIGIVVIVLVATGVIPSLDEMLREFQRNWSESGR